MFLLNNHRLVEGGGVMGLICHDSMSVPLHIVKIKSFFF